MSTNNSSGPTVVEYGLIVALIAVIVIAATQALSTGNQQPVEADAPATLETPAN